jgi:heme/copper-type cytochrome/quinol oxidase subunit 1
MQICLLYLIFSLFSVVVCTVFSVLIRLDLIGGGVQYMDYPIYNSIITFHVVVLIVELKFPSVLFAICNLL